MMWGATLILFSFVAMAQKMECRKFNEFPPGNISSPSFLADLKVELVTVGGKNMMNISWAINIDASLQYLTGTRITITGSQTYVCQYNPVLAEANLIGLKQKWFHYLVKASYGSNLITAANLPLPPLNSGMYFKHTRIVIPRVTPKPMTDSTIKSLVQVPTSEAVLGNVDFTTITVAIFGGLAGLIILSSCYMIYKHCQATFATSLGFKMLPTSSMAPVLVVYPAENSAFQRAVLALAEFLQWHGGCSVEVDMWQQGKIAELGPMRWLAEKAKTAQRVLIVCPQPSSQPSTSPPNNTFQEPSIPAAAHDLYPLILNMVASHAKSASDLAKFWVVQLGGQQDKKPGNLPLELRACKTFCLTKDLNKLCMSLHTQSQEDKEISDLIFRPKFAYSEKCTEKLREAVEKLGGHQPSILREKEPLKSVVIIV